MARMFAKCFFATLLILLTLLTTAPCSADQNLEAVSIGGFTWNLTETDLESMAEHLSGRANPDQRREFLWKTPNCHFAPASSTRQDLGNAANTASQQVVADNGRQMSDRFPFSRHECFLNEIFPQERCYVIENEYAWLATPDPTPRSANCIFDCWTNGGIPAMASRVLQLIYNKMSPVVMSLAKGVFQTASFTAQHARFPIESFPIHSVKAVKRSVLRWNRTDASDANPLRRAERLKPALLPIKAGINFEMSTNEAPFLNRKFPAIVDAQMARIKTPEQMDAYWNYYADCDRWNVVLAGGVADYAIAPNSNNMSTWQFGWVDHLVATAANLDIWLSQAFRQLESQSRSIGRDCQATWQGIEFHLFKASFAKSNGTSQKVQHSTKMRNPK